MSSTALLPKDQRSRKNVKKQKLSQSFFSIADSRSSLLSDMGQKSRQQEMENHNLLDESNIAHGSPNGALHGQNQLTNNQIWKEENYDDKGSPSKRRKNRIFNNSR